MCIIRQLRNGASNRQNTTRGLLHPVRNKRLRNSHQHRLVNLDKPRKRSLLQNNKSPPTTMMKRKRRKRKNLKRRKRSSLRSKLSISQLQLILELLPPLAKLLHKLLQL